MAETETSTIAPDSSVQAIAPTTIAIPVVAVSAQSANKQCSTCRKTYENAEFIRGNSLADYRQCKSCRAKKRASSFRNYLSKCAGEVVKAVDVPSQSEPSSVPVAKDVDLRKYPKTIEITIARMEEELSRLKKIVASPEYQQYKELRDKH